MFLSIDVFSEHIQSDCCSFQEQNQPPRPERDNNLTRISSSSSKHTFEVEATYL
jgi:hypothetical protein